jgi:hypothetical protein
MTASRRSSACLAAPQTSPAAWASAIASLREARSEASPLGSVGPGADSSASPPQPARAAAQKSAVRHRIGQCNASSLAETNARPSRPPTRESSVAGTLPTNEFERTVGLQCREGDVHPATGQTVAVGCDQLPVGAHGKEGVDWCFPGGALASPGTRIPQTSRASPTKTTLYPAYVPREVAGSSRRHPVIPASQLAKSTPAQPGNAKTGLSRRRSRVRGPSLPVKSLQTGMFCCLDRRNRPPVSPEPAQIPHGDHRVERGRSRKYPQAVPPVGAIGVRCVGARWRHGSRSASSRP